MGGEKESCTVRFVLYSFEKGSEGKWETQICLRISSAEKQLLGVVAVNSCL